MLFPHFIIHLFIFRFDDEARPRSPIIYSVLSLFLYSIHYPLQVSQRDFLVIGDKERCTGATQSFIEIKNPTILMNHYHVIIQYGGIDNDQSQHHKDGNVYTDKATAFFSLIVSIELEPITVPLLLLRRFLPALLTVCDLFEGLNLQR